MNAKVHRVAGQRLPRLSLPEASGSLRGCRLRSSHPTRTETYAWVLGSCCFPPPPQDQGRQQTSACQEQAQARGLGHRAGGCGVDVRRKNEACWTALIYCIEVEPVSASDEQRTYARIGVVVFLLEA